MTKKILLISFIFLIIILSLIIYLTQSAKKITIKNDPISSSGDYPPNKKQVTEKQTTLSQNLPTPKDKTVTPENSLPETEKNQPLSQEKIINKKQASTDKSPNNKPATQPHLIGLVNWGFSSGRKNPINTIIVHSVYNQLDSDHFSLSKILTIFKQYGVAPHYIIERNGNLHQLVQEKNTAYHAGTGKTPDGKNNVNDFSIGIEIINSKDNHPTEAQYQTLNNLIKQINKRYKIKYILGHNDIAPHRKTDPWNFNWAKIGGKKK